MPALIFTLLVGIGLVVIGHTPNKGFKPPAQFLYPPQDLKHFSLGYHEMQADLLWLRVIQDLDHCDQSDKPVSTPPLLSGIDPASERCTLGWVYHMIDSITELAPRFRIPYLAGATMLSVMVEDRTGAAKIFEKGIKQFPLDWELPYRAAYHYLFELLDRPRAADRLAIAVRNGAPEWVYVLSARIHTQAGQLNLAESVLVEALRNIKDPDLRKLAEDKLNEIRLKIKKESS